MAEPPTLEVLSEQVGLSLEKVKKWVSNKFMAIRFMVFI